jgi:hypothetical protein
MTASGTTVRTSTNPAALAAALTGGTLTGGEGSDDDVATTVNGGETVGAAGSWPGTPHPLAHPSTAAATPSRRIMPAKTPINGPITGIVPRRALPAKRRRLDRRLKQRVSAA